MEKERGYDALGGESRDPCQRAGEGNNSTVGRNHYDELHVERMYVYSNYTVIVVVVVIVCRLIVQCVSSGHL